MMAEEGSAIAMTPRNRRTIRRYVWSSTALGLVLGPGADVAPLIALWGAGFVELASDAELKFDEQEVVSAIAVIVASLGAWFVSGKVAQLVAAALVGGGLAGLGVTGGLSVILALFATLSLNATINALFTFRFLNACAAVIEDQSASSTVFLKACVNCVTDQLLSLAEIPGDLIKTAKVMIRPF
jgi:hypothetical protein